MKISSKILSVDLSRELVESCAEYGKFVVLLRAIPQLYDGLKISQRRLIYAAWREGYYNLVKSLAVCTSSQKSFHPHGEASIYGTLAKMCQPFHWYLSPFIPQGNWGSQDGDSPAAPRYTECKLGGFDHIWLSYMNTPTCVDYVSNYDGSTLEPTLLPVTIPTLLVNGSVGIAVGMRTNIPPHNPIEVIDYCIQLLNSPQTDWRGVIKGPDFPTGGTINPSKSDLEQLYDSGKGQVVLEARYQVFKQPLVDEIHITEIPYGVAKQNIMRQIKEAYSTQVKIPYLIDCWDESDRSGMLIKVKARIGCGEITMQHLMQHTDLRKNSHYLFNVVHNNQPQVLGVRSMVLKFIEKRKEVVYRSIVEKMNSLILKNRVLRLSAIVQYNIESIAKVLKFGHNFTQEMMGIDLEVPEWITAKGSRFSAEEVQRLERMTLGQMKKRQVDSLKVEYLKNLETINTYSSTLEDPTRLNKVLEGEFRASKTQIEFLNRKTRVEVPNMDEGQSSGASDIVMISGNNMYRVNSSFTQWHGNSYLGSSILKGLSIDYMGGFGSEDIYVFLSSGYCVRVSDVIPYSTTQAWSPYNIHILEGERVVRMCSIKHGDEVYLSLEGGRVSKFHSTYLYARKNRRFKISNRPITSACSGPAGGVLCVFQTNKMAPICAARIRTFNSPNSGRCVAKAEISSISLLPKGHHLITLSRDGYIKRFDTANMRIYNGMSRVVGYDLGRSDVIAAQHIIQEAEEIKVICWGEHLSYFRIMKLRKKSRRSHGVQIVKRGCHIKGGSLF